MYRVSPLEGRPYVSRTSSRAGFRRLHAPDAPRRLLGRTGSDDRMAVVGVRLVEGIEKVQVIPRVKAFLCAISSEAGTIHRVGMKSQTTSG
jgi:hypothetical protein